jgi:hypothetical protein
MAAGVLSQSGYFLGEHLYPADEGNPKGYFEDLEINRINEELLAQVVPHRPSGRFGDIFFRSRPVFWQQWLARLPVDISIPYQSDVAKRIQKITDHEPFCIKDPRFCYTLSIWRNFTKEPIFLCIFRHPGITAHSLVKEAQRDAVARHVKFFFNLRHALQVWELMYRHILEIHYPQGGDWIFMHYHQFLDGSAYDRLEKKLHAIVNRKFVDVQLNRSKISTTKIPKRLSSLYQKLCTLAGYIDENSE